MTNSATRSSAWRAKSPSEIKVDVVIPVLNEAHVLERSIRTLYAFFEHHVALSWRLVIAENGSTDGTAEVGRRLAAELPRVDFLLIGQRGRGRALRIAWSRPEADILCYTDVDLSTELEAFPRLFDALIGESYDVAIGSRLAPGSRTTRSFKRELISRAYNQILRYALRVGFSDAQTGFKAVTREIADRVLPLVEDQSWFLDTELLVLAETLGYQIADIPVVWIEDDDSRVKIVKTAWDDLKGVWRVRRMIRDNVWHLAQTRVPASPDSSRTGVPPDSTAALPRRLGGTSTLPASLKTSARTGGEVAS